jgi:ketosteroid isomerase-like protein
MKTVARGFLLLILVVLAGCAPQVAVEEVDIEAARAEVLETDLAFAAAASEGRDAELIASFWYDDAVVYPPDQPMVRGKAQILEFVRASLETPGFSVTWEPAEVQVGPSGLVAYTTGPNQFTMADPDGNLVTMAGRYVTIWQKQADGSWKCVLDIWNYEPADEVGPE